MPEHGTRGMRPIAEVGELPQSKQNGSLSTRITKNENTGDIEQQSQFNVTPPNVSLPKAGCAVRGVCEVFNASPFTGCANILISVKVTLCLDRFQTNLTLSYNSLFFRPEETEGIWL